MNRMSCAPRWGGGEALASRDGVGFREQPAGGLRPPRRLAAFSELPDRASRPLYLPGMPSSCQQAAPFPIRKTYGSALGASLDRGGHAASPLFPNSKKFCTRLTDSRAPPSIVDWSAVERSLGKTPTGDF